MSTDPADSNQGFGGYRARTRMMFETPVTAEMIAELTDARLDDHVYRRILGRVDTSSRAEVESLPPLVRTYLTTRIFEWEVVDGGLRQYFLNYEHRPWFMDLVLEGYTTLGLGDQRRVIEERIIPVAFSAQEQQIRAQDREDLFASPLAESQLDRLNDLVGLHDDVRVALIRGNPEVFAG